MLHRLIPLTIGLLLMASTPLALAQTVELLFEQGNTAQEAGNYTEAERLFRQAIQIEPNNFEAYKKLGNALYNQGKIEEAIASYQKALSLPDEKGTKVKCRVS